MTKGYFGIESGLLFGQLFASPFSCLEYMKDTEQLVVGGLETFKPTRWKHEAQTTGEAVGTVKNAEHGEVPRSTCA